MPFLGPLNIEMMEKERDLKGLVWALGHPDPKIRAKAALALGRIGEEGVVKPLVFSLGDKDISVREAVITALGSTHDPRAVKPLVGVLKDKEIWIRMVALNALGQLGNPEAVKPMLNALKDKAEGVRQAAASALGQIGSPEVANPLLTALKDPSEGVRCAAAHALGQIGNPLAIEPLQIALHDHALTVRKEAAASLEKFGWKPEVGEVDAFYWIERGQIKKCIELGEAAVDPLIQAITDARFPVLTRVEAVEVLIQIADERAFEPMIGLLKDRELSLQEVAIEGLGEIGDIRGVEPLIFFLKKGTPAVPAQKAAKALIKIGKAAVDPLISALLGSDCDLRRNAATILSRIGEKRAIEPLCKLLRDADPEVRKSGVVALRKLGWNLEEHEEGAYYWVAEQGWDECVNMGPKAVKALTEVLMGSNKSMRLLAIETLGKIDDLSASEALVAALQNGAPDIRQAVIVALGYKGDQRAVEALIPLLKDVEKDVRRIVVEALGKSSERLAFDGLVNALQDLEPSVRQAAIEALGQKGNPSVIKSLLPALKDPVKLIRLEAVSALEKLGWQPDKGEYGAIYWTTKERWEKCVEIGTPAVQPLIAALGEDYKSSRQAAQKALVEIGAMAVEELMVVLDHPKTESRLLAIEALGRIGDQRAIGALIEALRDKDKNIRQMAAGALLELGDRCIQPLVAALPKIEFDRCGEAVDTLEMLDWQPDKSKAGVIFWIQKQRWEKCIGPGQLAVDELILALKAKDHVIRQGAAAALGQIGDPRALEPLIKVLQDSDRGVRQNSAEALGLMGGSWRVIGSLIKALRDHEEAVRQAATRSLVKIGIPAVEALIALLKEQDVYLYATNALREIGDARAIEPLIAMLKQPDGTVRRVAAEALPGFGKPVIQPLVTALPTLDKEVHGVAVQVLESLGWQPDKSEAGAIYWIIKKEWDKCVAIGQPADDPLILYASDHDPGVRHAALKALGRTGGSRAIAVLSTALRDSSDCQAAAEALVEIGATAVPSLILALQDKQDRVCEAAAWALGKIGDPQPIPALTKALEEREGRVRKAIVESLDLLGWQPGKDRLGAVYWIAKEDPEKCAEIGEPAVPLLIKALEGTDWSVQVKVSQALTKIGAPAVKPLLKATVQLLRTVAIARYGTRLELYDRVERESISKLVRSDIFEILCNIGETTVEPLLAILREGDSRERLAAMEVLEKVGWVPDNSEAGAFYWVIKCQWDQCIKLGKFAVKSLLWVVQFGDCTARREAAGGLVNLYRSRKITDPQDMRLILAQRDEIRKPHTDSIHHYNHDCLERHADYYSHDDTGIGIEFPL